MNIGEHNRAAWDAQAERGNRWTVPVSPESMEAARQGDWDILLTPTKPVPRDWLQGISGMRVLCLASGGGQQAPILAAAGAIVTVLDNSPKQLQRDVLLAQKHDLTINPVLGDMADLGAFPSESFELIVHPVSNCFVPDVQPVWREAFRVLRQGGDLLSGFSNPVVYVFDWRLAEHAGRLEVKNSLPYSDIEEMVPEAIDQLRKAGVPLEFGHTLEAQIGGQIMAGFVITGMYEDRDPPGENSPLNAYMSTFIATRALRRAGGG